MSGPPMRRTGVLDLVIPLVVIGLSVYVLLRVSYSSIPPLGYVIPIPLAALAVIEFVAARRVRSVVRHDPTAKPMTAIAVARCVALGKASAVVGAAMTGASVALLGRVLPESGTVEAAAHDARVGGFLLGASILVSIAGLLLERAGIDPNRDRHEPGESR
jgi:Protein of unknown function (DUF3180)